MTPRATYRIQFHKNFDFDAAARLAPYLAKLGISHLYASPYFKAHPGSTHGYDIVDHNQLNPELGGEAGYARMVEALSANGLRQILDFVPNHMGVGGADNALWLDLLEWGFEADHAGWFDVDFRSDRPDLTNKILVPLLGDQYGVALENGSLILKFDAENGSFAVWAHEAHKLPICPLTYRYILGQESSVLERMGDAFADSSRWRPQVIRRTRDLKQEFARLVREDASVRDAVEKAVERFKGQVGDLASWDPLNRLIEQQNWKISHFRVASDDINYRRFFNISTLAGIRMELPDVFDHGHRLAFRLLQDQSIDGLRIDHIDGLFDPKAYLEKLREAAPAIDGQDAPYLVVEKILGRDEELRADWPIDGTTGYEFTNLLTGLFVDASAESAFTKTYQTFTGETQPCEDIVQTSKLQIIDDEMSSELHRLARAAGQVARQNIRTADFTLTVLRRALRQLVAAFPVYRTYIDGEGPPSVEDLARLDYAIDEARRNGSALDPSVFGFLRQLLSGELVAQPKSGYRRSDVFRCAMKFQQYCGPVMAKGVEDTAFYRFNRFLALNEVGGDPDHFGTSPAEFHDANLVRAERWPRAMLSTSTHDTKRGEDTRARLAALSALPERWSEQINEWHALLAGDETSAGPDRNDEYLFYQLLVGTWPVELLEDVTLPAILDDYVERLKSVMIKSMRESKVHSTWIAPDEAYETATLDFIENALRGAVSGRFIPALRPFAIRVATLGARATFAQTVLKFTVPGMPDTYQGAELWDLTMVDPDNRRPIDFTTRADLLDKIQADLEQDRERTIRQLWTKWQDGGFKLALTSVLLGLRREQPELLQGGSYQPLSFTGPNAEAYCGFLRRHGNVALMVVAERLPGRKNSESVSLSLPESIRSESGSPDGTSLLTGAAFEGRESVSVADVLDGYPAALVLYRSVA